MANEQSKRELKQEMNFIDPELTRIIFPWVMRHPRYLKAGLSLMRAVRVAKIDRIKSKEKGLRVPPFLILSITSECNLYCNGCFAQAAGFVGKSGNHTGLEGHFQLDYEKWHSILSEASQLGVMGFIIAGGEPFLFPGLLDLCLEFPHRIFVILTNGTTFSSDDYRKLKRSSNVVILVSIEGGEELTDIRRGNGVYKNAMETLAQLNKIGVPNGISVTVTRNNFEYWMDQKHIDQIIKKGVRIGVFIEYIPNSIESNSDLILMLTAEERERFRSCMVNFRKNKPIYIIHSPGDEEFFGGCVSAGRGFAHVTPRGDLTPCPVSNVATHNLVTSSLKEGLASPLFEEIRNNEHLLENKGTPCALFAHPKEVGELAKSVGAYRTDHYGSNNLFDDGTP